MTIREFILVSNLSTVKVGRSMVCFRPRVYCVDGFSLSVQAGDFLYSSPRRFSDIYTACELGYPSEVDSLISEFAEDEDNLLNTVYPYVGIERIEELIIKHGGIDIVKTFEGFGFVKAAE